jgi:hypothetical protein
MAKDNIDITPSSTSTFTSPLLVTLLLLLPFIIYFISGSYQSSDRSNMVSLNHSIIAKPWVAILHQAPVER